MGSENYGSSTMNPETHVTNPRFYYLSLFIIELIFNIEKI